MCRFLRDIELRMMDFPDEHKQFQCLLSATATQSGTLGEMLNEEQSETIVPLSPVKRIALNDEDHSKLTEMYKTLLPNLLLCSLRLIGSRPIPKGTGFQTPLKYGVLILKVILKCLSFQLKEFTVNV